MKIKEKPSDMKIEVTPLSADQKLTYYDKKKKEIQIAEWIDHTPFWNKNHVLAYTGCCGSGKTTCCLSLVASMSKKSRVYAGCYDMIVVCAPMSTLKSLEENPFETLPCEQIYHKFDEQFLGEMMEVTEENSMIGKDTLIIIDDASNQLKANKKIIDGLTNLIMKHRHLRCTIHLLVQDLIQLPLPIRENLSGVILFKQINSKRMKVFHEEYMSQLTYSEFLELNEYLYRRKGDFLFIKFSLPREYYKNFSQIFISSDYNHGNESKRECSCEEEN